MEQFSRQMQLITIMFLLGYFHTIANGCLKRSYGQGNIVCVCNEQHCDIIPPIKVNGSHQVVIYTSNKSGERFSQSYESFKPTSAHKHSIFEECHGEEYIKEYDVPSKQTSSSVKYRKLDKSEKINRKKIKSTVINQQRIYQEIIGWGGAFTDATGINIKSLGENLQKKIIESYFSDNGLEYNLCRVPIAGTDFSTHGYTYVDRIDDGDYNEDPLLTKFNLTEEDYLYKIPLIHEAQKLRSNLILLSSVWGAPKWMKENYGYGGMFGYLKRNMYKPWANYLVKFLDNYLSNNITFWGITSGNEVFFNMALQNQPGVLWTPDEQGKWISDFLGPALRSSQHSSVKLLVVDDMRPTLSHSVEKILSFNENSQFVDGIGIHWYFDTDNNSYILDETHHRHPDKFLLYTESCNGADHNDVLIGSWERGEAYAKSILDVVNRFVVGWIDWNMALDLNGGPTYTKNYVDSPILVNATAQEFYKQPMYYAIGHFSKFVPRGSHRIYASQCDPDIKVAAFKRPDNMTAIVVLNPTDSIQKKIFYDDQQGELQLELTPRSITSLVY